MPHLPSVLNQRPHTLHVTVAHVVDLLAEGWLTWPLETGGVLLGRVSGRATEVTAVVGPGPESRHARTRFEPDTAWQVKQIADLWSADPSIIYLGDWHTHPDGSTRLSHVDRGTGLTIAESPRARQPEPIMLVIALATDGAVEVAAHRFTDARWKEIRFCVNNR